MLKTSCKALIVAAALGIAAPAIAVDAAVQVKPSDSFGEYLTNAQGRSLYLFKADMRGKDAVSACYDACAAVWPPLVSADAPTAGDKAKADLLATTTRKDGAKQVTYNGWPLYYFIKDTTPGDTKGQDIEDFGEEWYLLTPAGEKVRGNGKDHD